MVHAIAVPVDSNTGDVSGIAMALQWQVLDDAAEVGSLASSGLLFEGSRVAVYARPAASETTTATLLPACTPDDLLRSPA